MEQLFYISSFVAIVATVMVITRYHPIHALLYLVVSFMAVAMIFLSLGARFVSVLEIIIYAGAIIVLFIFVVMMLNLGKDTALQEKKWLHPRVWVIPALLSLILLAEMAVLLSKGRGASMQGPVGDPPQVSTSLYGKYVIAVELAGFLLMAGIVRWGHICKQTKRNLEWILQRDGDGNLGASTEGGVVEIEEET